MGLHKTESECILLCIEGLGFTYVIWGNPSPSLVEQYTCIWTSIYFYYDLQKDFGLEAHSGKLLSFCIVNYLPKKKKKMKNTKRKNIINLMLKSSKLFALYICGTHILMLPCCIYILGNRHSTCILPAAFIWKNKILTLAYLMPVAIDSAKVTKTKPEKELWWCNQLSSGGTLQSGAPPQPW